jgi:hypothetical protein
MATALSELVHFVGEESALVLRARKAVEWVASKSEGHAVLEAAKKLHGEPVHVITDPSFVINNIGFGAYHGKPAVFVNPVAVETAKIITETGESIPMSLERFFSHEFEHAAQPNLLEKAGEYAQRRNQYFEGMIPDVTFEQYRHRIEATKGDATQLEGILGEIYDTHILAQSKAGLQRMVEKSAQDPVIQQFTAQYETPAIEFENLMMRKYKNEAGRTLDYTKSAVFDDEAWKADRQGFIDNATASIRANMPKEKVADSGQLRGGTRTDPQKREGGWAENS